MSDAGHWNASDPDDSGGSWTLLTGHGHILVEIARNLRARIRDISAVVGLTNRTVQAIVADLETAGYLTRARAGRRTRYSVSDAPLPASIRRKQSPRIPQRTKRTETSDCWSGRPVFGAAGNAVSPG
jgi:hypothetical protein